MFTENQNKVKPVQQDISEPLDNATDAAEQAAAGAKAFVGYLLISRCLIDHDVVGFGRPGKPADPKRGCYSHAEAWQYLLMQAAYKPRTYKIGRVPYNLDRGELVASERFLAEKWNWSRKSVRYFIGKLGAQAMVKKGPYAGPKVPTLSICNYDKYQVASDFKGPTIEGVGAQAPIKIGPKLKKDSSDTEVSRVERLRLSHPDRAGALLSEPKQLDILAEPVKPLPAPPAPRAGAASKAKASVDAVTAAFEVWARLAAEYKLPACRSVSPKRRAQMSQRLDQVQGDVAEFENILRREIAASDFLKGKIKPKPGSAFRQFEMTIDFVLQPSSWDKLIDGTYSRKSVGARSTQRIDIDQLQADAARSIVETKRIAEEARKSALDRIVKNRGW